MIHDEICTYELCKLAKDKWFPQDVFGTCEMKSSCYLEDGRYYKDGCIYPIENAYSAPTQSLLQRWLREEKNIHIEISVSVNDKHCFYWSLYCKGYDCWEEVGMCYGEYPTYELALEDALKYALEDLI